MKRIIDDCKERAVLHLRQGVAAEGDERAEHLRAVAEALVDKRADTPMDPDDATSDPDWRGKSYAYKHWVADVFTEAGIPAGERRRTQGAIAYHVNNVLHERPGLPDPHSLGINPKPLRDRRAEHRERTSNLNRLVVETGPFEHADDAAAAHTVVLKLLRRMSDKEQADVLRDAMLGGTPHLAGRVRMLVPDDEVTI